MAKFVVAGKSNCPFFAKAELLADYLAMNLPDFRVHKIVLKPEDWSQWLNKTCEERSFKHTSSPLIWRELIDRGGKGLYVGDCDDFLELANAFYLKVSEKLSEELLKISKENMQSKIEIDEELEEERKKINPIKVCVTGAASPIAYGIYNAICKGEIFGDNEEVAIQMFDDVEKQEVLSGVAMEIQDCAWPLMRAVEATGDRSVAFKDASLAILLDSLCLTEGKDKKAYLKENAAIFKLHAEALASHAKEGVRVLVVGGPANVNAGVVRHFAPGIPVENVCALSKLQENRAKSKLAKKLSVRTSSIKDVTIWGNISFNQHIDASNACVHGYDGAIWAPHLPNFTRPVPEMIHDEKWLTGDFVNSLVVQEEAFQALYNKYASTAMCNAVITQLHQWIQGSPEGEYFSLGVVSDGSYNIPEGVVFSLPVKFHSGKWEVVQGLNLDEQTKTKIQDIAKEIQQDTENVLKALESFDEEEQNTDAQTGGTASETREKIPETVDTTEEGGDSTKDGLSLQSEDHDITAEPSDNAAAQDTDAIPSDTKTDNKETLPMPEISIGEITDSREEREEKEDTKENIVESTKTSSEDDEGSTSNPHDEGVQEAKES